MFKLFKRKKALRVETAYELKRGATYLVEYDEHQVSHKDMADLSDFLMNVYDIMAIVIPTKNGKAIRIVPTEVELVKDNKNV